LVAGDLHKETFKGILKKKHYVYQKKILNISNLSGRTTKRDMPKKPTKETYNRDLQKNKMNIQKDPLNISN